MPHALFISWEYSKLYIYAHDTNGCFHFIMSANHFHFLPPLHNISLQLLPQFHNRLADSSRIDDNKNEMYNNNTLKPETTLAQLEPRKDLHTTISHLASNL